MAFWPDHGKIKLGRTEEESGLNLRKWMKLFGMTILVGGAASLITGVCMQLADPQFRNIEADGWLYNILMIALSGMTFGAFAHMGFFAYLMLNYIARSIFKSKYTWLSLQAFVTLFVLVEIVYWTYGEEKLPVHTFWLMPLVLLGASLLIAWRKVSETSSGAWIPTLFFLISLSVLEAIPSFQANEGILPLVFQLLPLFVCNAYQIMMLHRILDKSEAPNKTPAEAG